MKGNLVKRDLAASSLTVNLNSELSSKYIKFNIRGTCVHGRLLLLILAYFRIGRTSSIGATRSETSRNQPLTLRQYSVNFTWKGHVYLEINAHMRMTKSRKERKGNPKIKVNPKKTNLSIHTTIGIHTIK